MFGWQNDLSNVSPKCCEVLGPPLSQSALCFPPQRWTRNSSSKSKRSQPVLLCRLGRQAPSLRAFTSRAPRRSARPGRQAIHHPPSSRPARRRGQSGGRWGHTCGTARPVPPPPSARLRGCRCPGEAPLSPRPGLDRCVQVTGRGALGARRWRPGVRRIAGRFVFADTCFGWCVWTHGPSLHL